MPLLPIDLQTLFSQTSQVGKEQAVQKNASPLTQSLQGAQMVQKTEQQDNDVNETHEPDEGAEKVKDRAGPGGGRKRDTRAQKQKLKAPPPAARKVVQDPALGRNIDITS
jgi:hypothetical protein